MWKSLLNQKLQLFFLINLVHQYPLRLNRVCLLVSVKSRAARAKSGDAEGKQMAFSLADRSYLAEGSYLADDAYHAEGASLRWGLITGLRFLHLVDVP